MRKLLFALLSILLFQSINFSYAQEWSQEHIAVLDHFGLEKNDIRGIVFKQTGNNSCNQEVQTVHEALDAFLNAAVKRDITTYCIAELNTAAITFDQPLDLFQIVSVYIETKK